jgi:hypothetical protein
LAGDQPPKISVLSDDFLDKVTKGLAAQPALGVELLKKILRARTRAEELDALLDGRVREEAQRVSARTPGL